MLPSAQLLRWVVDGIFTQYVTIGNIQVLVNKLHVEGVFPTLMVPEVTKIGPDGAASLLGIIYKFHKSEHTGLKDFCL